MLSWTITSVTRYGCFNCQKLFLKSATQELIEVSPEPKEKTLLLILKVKMLEEKDDNEEKAKEELKKQAKSELEDWYKQHSEQLSKLQEANRAASISYEQELETTTEKLIPGTEWERVAKLCDFNPKTARNTKDVGRMRSVILQLKQEGSAPIVPHGV